MAVYVDELRDYQALIGAHLPGLWCHMVTDGALDELHHFAMRIGINRRRFQNHPRHPHYDLMASSRAIAVACGAVEVNTRELYRIVTLWSGVPWPGPLDDISPIDSAFH